mgnify:CR=1 FL=1
MEVGNGVDGRSLSIQGTARWKKKKIHKPLIVNVEEGQ